MFSHILWITSNCPDKRGSYILHVCDKCMLRSWRFCWGARTQVRIPQNSARGMGRGLFLWFCRSLMTRSQQNHQVRRLGRVQFCFCPYLPIAGMDPGFHEGGRGGGIGVSTDRRSGAAMSENFENVDCKIRCFDCHFRLLIVGATTPSPLPHDHHLDKVCSKFS